MSAREEILDRIGRATADVPADEVSAWRGHDALAAHAPGSDLVRLFRERAADLGASVIDTDGESLAAAVAGVLASESVRRLIVPRGLPGEWLASCGEAVTLIDDRPDLPHGALDNVDGVLTGVAVAIAETGTVVLDGSADQGRRALTLLPDLHVCVVRADQVVADVPEAVVRLDASVRLGRPLTFITGPSATSDIELRRVEGVHGPRRLRILVVDSSTHFAPMPQVDWIQS